MNVTNGEAVKSYTGLGTLGYPKVIGIGIMKNKLLIIAHASC